MRGRTACTLLLDWLDLVQEADPLLITNDKPYQDFPVITGFSLQYVNHCSSGESGLLFRTK